YIIPVHYFSPVRLVAALYVLESKHQQSKCLCVGLGFWRKEWHCRIMRKAPIPEHIPHLLYSHFLRWPLVWYHGTIIMWDGMTKIRLFAYCAATKRAAYA
ncbi:MAG: hypothetical protein KDK05_30435, partial [Candidatus Competibacteraceae bacterium]|nr:hypothetical protein [Candidatus Competibacteraceae bacterium]